MTKDDLYLHTFNELAGLLEYGDAIDYFCYSRDECEKTMMHINAIVQKMNKLVEKMEL